MAYGHGAVVHSRLVDIPDKTVSSAVRTTVLTHLDQELSLVGVGHKLAVDGYVLDFNGHLFSFSLIRQRTTLRPPHGGFGLELTFDTG